MQSETQPQSTESNMGENVTSNTYRDRLINKAKRAIENERQNQIQKQANNKNLYIVGGLILVVAAYFYFKKGK
jgi:hypothetical protein